MREYVGSGVVGELAAAADALARQEAQAEARAWKALRARLETAGQISESFFDSVNNMAKTALVLSGYHYHRGEWRRIRG